MLAIRGPGVSQQDDRSIDGIPMRRLQKKNLPGLCLSLGSEDTPKYLHWVWLSLA